MTMTPLPPLSPGDIGDTVGFRLRVAQIAAYRNFEGRFSRYGIAPRYLGLLGIIETHPGQPQSRLAEAIALKRSSLVPIIDRLEADRLVERRSAPADRRYKSVWLTAKGKRVVSELKARALAEEEKLTAGMTPTDRQALLDLLSRLIGNLAQSPSIEAEPARDRTGPRPPPRSRPDTEGGTPRAGKQAGRAPTTPAGRPG